MGFFRKRSLNRLFYDLDEAERRCAHDPAALTTVVDLWDRILAHPDVGPNPTALNGAGWSLLTRFQTYGAEFDLRAATRRFEEAFAESTPDSGNRWEAAANLCVSLSRTHEWFGDHAALDRAIALTEPVMSGAGTQAPARLASALAEARFARYRRIGRDDDRARAIALAEYAVATAPDVEATTGYARNLRTMHGAASGMHAAARMNPSEEAAARAAAAGAPPGSPDRGGYLLNHGVTLYDRYVREGDLADLDEAVAVLRQARTAVPAVAAPYAGICAGLAVALLDLATRRNRAEPLDEAIGLLVEAMDRTDPHAPDYAAWLSIVGNVRSERYARGGDPADLDAAIEAYREAVDRLPAGNVDRPALLNNLGSGHWDRYGRNQQPDDLAAAADAYRQSLAGLPADAGGRATVLGNLANVLAEFDDPDAGATYRRATRSGLESAIGNAVVIAEAWGRWAAGRDDWAQADEGYGLALTAMHRLRERQLVADDRETWLLATHHLPAAGAYAAVRRCRAADAVMRLETGRALALSEALQRDQRRLAALAADPALRPLAERFQAAARILAGETA